MILASYCNNRFFMPQKKDNNKDDSNLFRQQMKDVTRLDQDKIRPEIKQPKAVPRQFQANEQQVMVDMMSDDFDAFENDTGEELHFIRDGIQSRVVRKLKRGQFRIEGEIDLHGLNVEAARQAISTFLLLCQSENRRCIRIIHGKGLSSKHKGPVLKQMVNRWLRQRKEVLAFTSALPQHGGTGAIYVLLKKPEAQY